ncbi:MAG: immunoglobulin domain-containing protein [Verrucomicrobia bacterium]|jgi:hypothetical protein|nr:immunoglobulin domain-containing protein [Verrucomicrobiota bacterium]
MNKPIPTRLFHSVTRVASCAAGLKVSSALRRSVSAMLVAACFMGFAIFANAVTVKVDSTKTWLGFNNVIGTNGWSSYQFGSPWALPDLRATFYPTNVPTGWPLRTSGVLQVNTNTYAPGTGAPPDTNYWNYSDGTANKLIEANLYVDAGTNYGGDTVTFQGTVLSNTIPMNTIGGLPTVSPARWQVVAFIKEFSAPGVLTGITETTNLSAGAFSINRAIPAGYIAQYGFKTFGPNTGPGSPDALTGLGVQVEDSDPAIFAQPTGVLTNLGSAFNLSVKAFGATTLSYQWQKNGTNLANGGTISGATSTNLVISSAVVADTGSYRCVVTDTAGTAVSTAVTVTIFDILITDQPDDLRLPVGSTAEFTVGATSANPITYQWRSIIGGVTNVIAGATNATLTLTNVQTTASGTYYVTITAGANSVTADAILRVRTPADWVNFLENPGFEDDPAGLNESPWVRFGEEVFPLTPDIGAFVDSSDVYYGQDPVNVYAGTYVSFTTFNGTWSGIYQDVPTTPGTTFSADMWFYHAGGSGGDPMPGPWLPATNECYLEIQFRNNLDQCIHQYISSLMDYTTQSNVWFQLAATNAGAYSVPNTPPTNNTPYLVAPEGTVSVRFQVTLHNISGSSLQGSLYYDNARLMLKLPVTLKVSQSGGNTLVSWETLGATSYQVQYKNSLSDVTWTNLEVVAGTGSTVTRSYSSAGTGRLYRVLTL